MDDFRERLLADVLAEEADSGLRDTLLGETLRHARRKRRLRRMRRCRARRCSISCIAIDYGLAAPSWACLVQHAQPGLTLSSALSLC